MKKFSLCAALLALGVGSVFANPCCSPSPCPESCCGEWEVFGDYLYMLPTFCEESGFVVSGPSANTSGPVGTSTATPFDFSSGFRVGGSYKWCDTGRELYVAYSWLRSSANASVAGDHLWARHSTNTRFQNFAGSASSNVNFLYQRVDGLFYQHFFNCCRFDLDFVGGLEYFNVSSKANDEYLASGGVTVEADEANVRVHRNGWGIGPQVGFDAEYVLCRTSCSCLPGTLSIDGFFTGSLLMTKLDGTTYEDSIDTNQGRTTTIIDNVTNPSVWLIVPAFHTSFGLRYDTHACCSDLSFGIGYEFNQYIGCDEDSFGVQGLYVSVGAGF